MNNKTYLYFYEFDYSLNLNITNFFSNYRLEKLNNMTNVKKIQENIQIEYLLYNLFNKHLNKRIEKLDFIISKQGRPIFNDLYFNISHSNNLLIIAINTNFDISVDLEYINNKRLVVKNKLYKDSSNKSIDDVILDWTKKEAFVKLNEMTILSNLKDINIYDTYLIFDNLKSNYESFKYQNYYVTVCSNNLIELNINHLKQDDLI